MANIMDKYVDKNEEGVCVQASTLGSLEALLEFLLQMGIPVCSVNIGPIYKRDVLKALKSRISERSKKEYASILAFDVRVIPEAAEYAETNGIRIFTANIIYHLFD
jgi:translation initiation factor 5B